MATTKPKAGAAKAAGPETKGLEVISKVDGFRRAGRAFGDEPKTIPLSDLTPDQAEQLRNEPKLIVREIDIEPAEAGQAEV